MKKLALFITLSLSFIFMFLLLSCGGNKSSNDKLLDSARSIKIVQIEGTATVSDDKEELTCFKGMNLYDGDSLYIGPNSVLVIRFDDDKYVYLGEDTKINIKSEGNDKYKTNVFVERGIVLAEIQNKLGEDEEFFLSSNNSVMAVRGTVFGLEVKEVNNELIEIYSVFKGVTELFAFDKVNGEVVKGKLTDISNKKIELKVNKDKIINEDEFKEITDNWMDDVKEKYDDYDDANSKMDEVEITVSTPTEEDYKKVVDTISEETQVTYSPLTYTTQGYFDNYDGNPHKINVVVDNPNAKVYYRDENSTTYQETNNFEYTNPGSYRVYYKIVCEGYTDKEDFEVINIYKKNLEVSLKTQLNVDCIVGETLEHALKDINLFDYIEVNGVADKDKSYLSNSTFNIEGRLKENQNNYEIKMILPDDLKAYYNDAKLNVYLNPTKITYNASAITTSPNEDKILLLNDSMTFNKYNGVKQNDIFYGIEFIADNEIVRYSDISYEYNHTIDGYVDLVEGVNKFTVTFSFVGLNSADTYDIIDEFEFKYTEYRDSESMRFTLGDKVSNLGGSDYFYNTNGLNNTNIIGIGSLLSQFGLSNYSVLVNYSKDVLDDTVDLYNRNGILSFTKDTFTDVKFTIFPTNEKFMSEKSIRILFSDDLPQGYPTYTISNDLTYQYNQSGVSVDFIETSDNVVYSLDGNTYNSSLVLTDLGEYEVFYKVGSTVIVEGSAIITISTSTIYSENLDMISSNINIISDDNHELYVVGEVSTRFTITSTDSTTITPLEDVYTVYRNILMNSKYYDSITKEELTDVDVYVSDKNDTNANFTYRISKTGYETIEGSVTFSYSEFGYTNSMIESITNPIDLSLPYDSDGYTASRIMTTFENSTNFTYYVYYSIDNGQTWTTEEPVLIEKGNYTVYCLYNLVCDGLIGKNGSCTLSPNGNYIVSIQNITIN